MRMLMRSSKGQFAKGVATACAIICVVAITATMLYIRACAARPSQPVQRSEYLPSPLETLVLGQSEWLAGVPASLRIIVRNHEKGAPIAGAFVNVSLKHAQTGRTVKLMSGRTNSFGTLEQSFTVPSWATGRNELAIKVRTSIGEDEVKEAIIVRDEARIMLTTDKPLYQPSQVIHMRALCLHPATLKPVASVRVTFEVEDPKGNKVFRKRVQTSRFGIASVDFQLADEINLGNYTVRAIAQRQGSKGGWRTIGEVTQTVKVDRYVLPKFKVALETKKRFYLPGDEFEGVIKANYFFGKPVAGGEVLIKLSSFDVKWSDFAELRGRTDENGVYRFKHRLPTYFVGQPLEQGKALLKVEVRVTDKAEHEEHITETFPVAKEAISVVVIPESQSIARDVANTLFIVTTYPDGTPAKTKVTVSGKGIKWSGATDAMGIAEMQFVPRSERVRFTVKARDAQGNVGHLVKAFERKVNEEAIILRTNKAIAKVGDVLKLTILSTRRGGTVYLDAIRGRQTVLTKAIELNGARRAVRLPLTEQMMGTLTLHAYRITRTGHIIRDTKVTYVNPATDLRIAVKPDRKTYLPGGRAQVDFAVTDAQGHPVLAALGITIVDESVYALQEMQPGLEKVYFMLEREIMKPRYEIHGFEPLRILRERPPMPRVEARPVALDETKERAARVLFAAAMPNLHTLHVNTWKVRAEKLREKWLEHGRKVYKRIWNALARYHKRHGEYPAPDEAIDALVREKFITRRDTLDPLGNPYRIKAHGRGWGRRVWSFVLISAGPDGKFGTDDDVRVLPLVFAKGDVRVQAIREMPLRALAGGIGEVEKFRRTAVAPPSPGAQQIRIRQFFPETLLFMPQLITDERGHATLNLTMADSITTWRLTAMASSLNGLLGSTTAPIRVFQDFFVDIDLPVSLTQNDEVSIPVAIYNYLPTAQTVRLQLQREDWFEPTSGTERTVRMKKGDVGVVYFPIRAKRLGTHSLTVIARGEKMSDAIKRTIRIVPDGKEVWLTINDSISKTVRRTVKIPRHAIDGASTILVRIYGGGFSQVVDGLDKLLRMPFGCFEQTSSVTYPNVLVLDYMKRTKQIKPEIQMKAEQFINLGYQRLLTFEVKGGGFSWFGRPPAHKVLTAYGLMEFYDMSRVYEIDPQIITRTRRWLISKQRQDGSWDVDPGGIREGVINRQTDVLRVTAYITWALVETAGNDTDAQLKRAVARAVDYISPRVGDVDDAYALAVIANALVGWDRNSALTRRVIERLVEMAIVEGAVAYWRTKMPTFTYSKGKTADLETTALAAYALLKARVHPDLTNKALTYLVRNKDAFGTWHSTQATIWSLKALLLATEGATAEIDARIAIRCNGKEVARLRITPEDSDIVRQVDLREFVREGVNEVTIEWDGKGTAVYQIGARFYLPWRMVRERREFLDIAVDYDRRELSVNDIVQCTVTVRNNQPVTAKMVIVDIGIPPGFQVLTEDLTALVEEKVIQRFNMTGRQLIIYLDEVRPRQPIRITYRLKARYPIRAQSGKAIAYEYYAPDQTRTEAKPVEFVVRR